MKRDKKSRKERTIKIRQRDLELTGQTVISRMGESEGKGQDIKKAALVLLLPCLLSALMLQGLLLDYCKVWEVEYQKEWNVYLLLISLTVTVVAGIGKRFRTLPWIAAALLAAAGLCSLETFVEGGRELANPVLRSWSKYYRTTLWQYKLGEESGLEPTLFYLALWLAFGFIWAMQKEGRRILLAAPPAALFMLGLLIGKGPDVGACLYLLTGLLPALALAGNIGVLEEKAELAGTCFTAVILAAGFILFALLRNGMTTQIFKEHDTLLAFQKNIEQNVMDFFAEIPGGFSIFGGNSDDGVITNRSPHYTGKEMFWVTVDEKPKIKYYFRGFVGDTYENGRWSPVSEEAFAEKVSKWGYTKGDAGRILLNMSSDYAGQVFQTAADSNLQSRPVTMEILYSDDCGEYAFLPYFTNLLAHEMDALTVEADAVVRKPKELGHIPVYTAEMTSYDAQRDVLLWRENEQAKLVEEYEEEVKRTYTEVPKAGVGRILRLADAWAKQGFGVEKYDINYAIPIRKVTEELAERTEYSRSLGRVPRGTDVVENFLFDSKEGFCVHYASAAALLLRRLGVPARYVSGYAAEPGDFSENADGSYSAVIKDEMGHAWVEVYMRGLGWIPVEVTKGSQSMGYGMDSASAEWAQFIRESYKPESSETQNNSRPEPESEKRQETEREVSPNPSATDGKQRKSSQTDTTAGMFIILSGVLLLAVAIAVILWKRKELEGKRRFFSRDTKVAALEISHGICKELYRAEVIKEKNMTDEAYIRMAAEKLNFLGDGEFETFLQTVQRSVFSEYTPSEEEVKAGRKIYWKIAAAIRNKTI